MTGPGAIGTAGMAGGERESRVADMMLTRVADSRVLAAAGVPARAWLLFVMVVLALAGVWLRGYAAASWPLVTVWVAVTGLALGLPWLARFRGEPGWADAARVHARGLEGRVPVTCLDIAARYARVTGERMRRDVFLYIPRCVRPAAPHLGACHLAGVLPLNGGLLVVAGEHLAAGPPHVVAGALGHQALLVTGWRYRVTCLRTVLAVAGPFLLGWAVPWPVLPAALAAFTAITTAVAWVTVISCDLGPARENGPGAVLAALDYLAGAAAGGRAAVPAWKNYAAAIVTWITGPPHPPHPVRRALIRTLARDQGGPGGGRAA